MRDDVVKRTAAVVAMLMCAVAVGVAPSGAQTEALRVGTSSTPVGASIEVSRSTFADSSARTVVIGRDDVFADSLAGAALAGDSSPLLFVEGGDRGDLGSSTRSEIRRVLGPGAGCGGGADIYLLGSTTAVSTDIEDDLEAEGYCTHRLGGATRVETALAVADEVVDTVGQVEEVLIARADDWADAATGGAYAAYAGTPILVTPTDSLHPAVEAWLDAHAPLDIRLLGGTAAISERVAEAADRHGTVTRVAGTSREATAVKVAEDLWPEDIEAVTVVSGFDELGWAYAFAGAVPAAQRTAPELYANPSTGLSTDTTAFLEGQEYSDILIVGGTDQVSESAEQQVVDRAVQGPVFLTLDRRVDADGICSGGEGDVRLNGLVYPRSFFQNQCLEPAYMTFDLGRDFERLRATIGHSDVADEGVAFRWEVYLDDVFAEQFTTEIGVPHELDIDVTGAQRIRFVPNHSGTTSPSTSLVFGTPRLYTPDTVDQFPQPDPATPAVDTVFLDEVEIADQDSYCSSADGAHATGGSTYPRSIAARYCLSDRLGYHVFWLGRDFGRFRAVIGIRDDQPDGSTAQVSVIGDGRVLQSGQVGIGTPMTVDVDVTDVLRLRIDTFSERDLTMVYGTARVVVPGGADSAPPPVD